MRYPSFRTLFFLLSYHFSSFRSSIFSLPYIFRRTLKTREACCKLARWFPKFWKHIAGLRDGFPNSGSMLQVCAMVSQILEACCRSARWFPRFWKHVAGLRGGFPDSGSMLQPCDKLPGIFRRVKTACNHLLRLAVPLNRERLAVNSVRIIYIMIIYIMRQCH